MKTRILLSCVAACSLGALAVTATADPAPGMYGPATKVVITDSAITSSIKAQYEGDHGDGLQHVRVDTDDHGVVKLDGEVRSQAAADRAIAIAKATEGVREVRSDIEVEKDD
jgi:hyperosmotically inducible periplasmic protein